MFSENLKPFQADESGCEKIDWHIGTPAAADLADAILLFGGDGTIHRHLSQLVKLALPVLVVPAGSGKILPEPWACAACAIRSRRGGATAPDRTTFARSIWEYSGRWKSRAGRPRHTSFSTIFAA
jgi:hypothetical protein